MTKENLPEVLLLPVGTIPPPSKRLDYDTRMRLKMSELRTTYNARMKAGEILSYSIKPIDDGRGHFEITVLQELVTLV